MEILAAEIHEEHTDNLFTICKVKVKVFGDDYYYKLKNSFLLKSGDEREISLIYSFIHLSEMAEQARIDFKFDGTQEELDAYIKEGILTLIYTRTTLEDVLTATIEGKDIMYHLDSKDITDDMMHSAEQGIGAFLEMGVTGGALTICTEEEVEVEGFWAFEEIYKARYNL